ncbi:hypothetical protein SUDANB106_03022 [Streptomyces sp. enrichment culture]
MSCEFNTVKRCISFKFCMCKMCRTYECGSRKSSLPNEPRFIEGRFDEEVFGKVRINQNGAAKV